MIKTAQELLKRYRECNIIGAGLIEDTMAYLEKMIAEAPAECPDFGTGPATLADKWEAIRAASKQEPSRAELLAQLAEATDEGCNCRYCTLFREAAAQIEADGKRIAELENQLKENLKVLDTASDALEKADGLVTAVAEAVREAAIDSVFRDSDLPEALAEDVAINIRALPLADIIQKVTQ